MSDHLSVEVEEIGELRKVTVVFTPTPPPVTNIVVEDGTVGLIG